MTNPWLARNPYMSMWLSVANTTAAHQRSAINAELGRQQADLARQWIQWCTEAWLAWLPEV